MENHGSAIQTLTIADLIQRSEAITGSSSIQSITAKSAFLQTLSDPSILVGTVTLPPSSATLSPTCHCLRFSDSSSSSSPICCHVLNFSPTILGHTIQIATWNFIPAKSKPVLEIIQFNQTSSTSNTNNTTFPLSSAPLITHHHASKPNYFAYGGLESVSPVTVVPCAIRSRDTDTKTHSKRLCGFLVKMFVCDCRFCKCRDVQIALRHLEGEDGESEHRFHKPMILYFCGAASVWHFVLTGMIGKVFLVSGLEKKVVYIGKDESQLMYVTTERSVLHLPKVARHWPGYHKVRARGRGECACYRGTVTASYMNGMVIELDRQVMLLLTQPHFRVPHSLRVGAIISIKNVHFVNPRFPWTRVLILGACYKTSITVELFSPLETGCYVIAHSQSLIEKFVQSLCFCARLWMLLLITTLRRKFSEILSEKDILGTRNMEGLAQKFASSHLPLSAFRCQNGVFMDFCKHDSCRCGGSTGCGHFKLVVPMSNLLSLCKISVKETRYEVLDSKKVHNSISCGGITYYPSAERILHGERLGVILLGYLKISSSTGRLQLVDATGKIDVAFPNLPSNWHCNRMIEIKDFNITVEVPSGDWDQKPLGKELFSCQSIFSTSPPLKEVNTSFYLTFTCNQEFIHPGCPSEVNWKGNCHVFNGGTFHMLWLVHKFPILSTFQGEQVDSNKLSVFAEAVVLPWDLLLAEKNSDAHLHVNSCDQLKDTHAHMIPADIKISRNENCERVSLKRCKIDKLMSQQANANSTDAKGGGLSSSSLPTNSSCGRQNSCESRCPYQIPCDITGKFVSENFTGLLKCRDFKERTGGSCSMRARKVLLEFNLESFCEYQALQVNGYYILKHCHQDLSSSKETKLLITSGMHFWSCSISFPEIPQESYSVSSAFQSCHLDVKKEEKLNKLDTCSDINISIPSYFKNDVKFDTDVWDSFGRLSLLLEGGMGTLNCKQGITSTSCPSSEMTYHDQVLPEGNLMSFHGLVTAVHNSNDIRFSAQAGHFDALPQPVLLQGKSSICIHLVTDNRDVKISGQSHKGACPAGIRIGVRATFHRILELNGQNDYMLIPASFIEIDSSCPLNEEFGDGNSYTSSEADPFGPNSEILHTECQPLQLHCRVLAVYALVLEKTRRTTSCEIESSVDIILAGFVLDSGTSSYCCWANHEAAAALLKLHIEKCQSISCKLNASKQFRKKEGCGSTIHRLHKILQKYGRIVVKNDGSVYDSLCHDLTISVSSEETISFSDENILRRLILNSCFSTIQTVVGSVMDDSTIKQLEKYLAECQMNIPPLQNIWATKVHQINPLSEARNICEGLVSTS